MITYINGDATSPQGDGPKIIAHICNINGGWGAGFVLALSRKWSEPEAEYREWFANKEFINPDGEDIIFELGNIQIVSVGNNTYVCNMLSQSGYLNNKTIPLQYDALEECLTKLGEIANRLKATIHMPRIGCALAGGKWSLVEPIIKRTLAGIPVTVYDYGKFNE